MHIFIKVCFSEVNFRISRIPDHLLRGLVLYIYAILLHEPLYCFIASGISFLFYKPLVNTSRCMMLLVSIYLQFFYLLFFLLCFLGTGTDEKNIRNFYSYPDNIQNEIGRSESLKFQRKASCVDVSFKYSGIHCCLHSYRIFDQRENTVKAIVKAISASHGYLTIQGCPVLWMKPGMIGRRWLKNYIEKPVSSFLSNNK